MSKRYLHLHLKPCDTMSKQLNTFHGHSRLAQVCQLLIGNKPQAMITINVRGVWLQTCCMCCGATQEDNNQNANRKVSFVKPLLTRVHPAGRCINGVLPLCGCRTKIYTWKTAAVTGQSCTTRQITTFCKVSTWWLDDQWPVLTSFLPHHKGYGWTILGGVGH